MKPEEFLAQFNGYHLDSTERYVYRYRTAERALMEIQKGTLRISPFPELNDPKEFADWHFGFAASNSFDADTNWPELERQATAHAKNFAKVLCTTLDDSTALNRGDVNSVWGRGFSRPRMWQQYSENYCGACMVFDRATLDAAVRASGSGSKLFVDRARYANAPRVFKNHPLLNPFMLNYDRIKSVGMARAMTEHAELHWQALFFDKALDWQTEKEFRWLIWDTEHKAIVFDFRDALKAVVVGETFARLDDLHDLCAPLKVPVWEMRWKNGSPEPIPTIRRGLRR
jgi:DUF2971 family protein